MALSSPNGWAINAYVSMWFENDVCELWMTEIVKLVCNMNIKRFSGHRRVLYGTKHTDLSLLLYTARGTAPFRIGRFSALRYIKCSKDVDQWRWMHAKRFSKLQICQKYCVILNEMGLSKPNNINIALKTCHKLNAVCFYRAFNAQIKEDDFTDVLLDAAGSILNPLFKIIDKYKKSHQSHGQTVRYILLVISYSLFNSGFA